MTMINERGARHSADDVTRTTVRLPSDVAEALRTYVFLTRESGNGVIVEALRQFLTGPGRDAMVAASARETMSRYGAVLDKLGDSSL